MTTYKEIKGNIIEVVPSDPANPGEGDIWYNSTIGVLKGHKLNVAAWASGGNMNTSRRLLSGCGTQTAALGVGGFVGGVESTNSSEEYDGSTWTASTYPAAQYGIFLFGTQTAAIGASGYLQPTTLPTNVTKSYNGSSWTNLPATINTGRELGAAAGVQTAGIAFGGYPSYPTTTTATETWDGTSWAVVNSMNTARAELASANQGTQTASLAFGGNIIPVNTSTDATEEYDGTSWTTASNMNTGRFGLAGGGTQTLALAMTGRTSPPNIVSALVEEYDGSSWTNTTPVSTARGQLAGGGTVSAGIAFGGSVATITNVTEEYTGAYIATQKIDTN